MAAVAGKPLRAFSSCCNVTGASTIASAKSPPPCRRSCSAYYQRRALPQDPLGLRDNSPHDGNGQRLAIAGGALAVTVADGDAPHPIGGKLRGYPHSLRRCKRVSNCAVTREYPLRVNEGNAALGRADVESKSSQRASGIRCRSLCNLAMQGLALAVRICPSEKVPWARLRAQSRHGCEPTGSFDSNGGRCYTRRQSSQDVEWEE